jgi:hypothetical protein
MGQKRVVIFLACLFALFLIFSNLSSARAVPEGVLYSGETENVEEDLQVDAGTPGDIFSDPNTGKDYLLNEVIKIIQDNPIVNFLDSVFVKLESIGVFRALFGVNWESKTALSFSILLSVILWVLFFFYLTRQFTNFFGVSSIYCYLYSVALVLISAHLQLLLFLSKKIILVFTSVNERVALSLFLITLIVGLIALDFWGGYTKIRRKGRITNERLKKIEVAAKMSDSMTGGQGLSKKAREKKIEAVKIGANINIAVGEEALRLRKERDEE